MKPVRRRSRPSYVDKIADAHARGVSMGRIKAPGIFVVDVLHDDDCPRLLGTGECTCDVEIGEFHRVEAPEVV